MNDGTTAANEIAWAVTACRREGIQDAEDYATRILAELDKAGFMVVRKGEKP